MRCQRDGRLPGEENMRRDVALLERGEPALRLYGWAPAAVSLGRAQRPDAVDLDAARRMAVDVVRRPTGGAALLHEASEVTYAVVLPRAALPDDVAESYAVLTGPLVRALRAWGLPAELERGPAGARNDLCYLRREGVHVTVRGRKISGGAQLRTADAVLQHGTLLVERDADAFAALFRAPRQHVEASTTSLREWGVTRPRERLEDDVEAAYRAAFAAAAPTLVA